jgi:hypothetical protein
MNNQEQLWKYETNLILTIKVNPVHDKIKLKYKSNSNQLHIKIYKLII